MKITDIECAVLLAPNCNVEACDSAQDTIVVEVRTDEGLTGIGEVDTNPWVAKAHIESPGSHLMGLGPKELLLGQDPSQPQAIWERLYTVSAMTGRRGAGICAIGALGEWLQTRFEFEELIDRGHADVVQPDVGRVGGFTEALRVVQLAQDRGKIVVPHNWKTGIGVAATAHLAAVASNCRFIECQPSAQAESPLRRELVVDDFEIVAGKLALAQKPGLGAEINSEAFNRLAEEARLFMKTSPERRERFLLKK